MQFFNSMNVTVHIFSVNINGVPIRVPKVILNNPQTLKQNHLNFYFNIKCVLWQLCMKLKIMYVNTKALLADPFAHISDHTLE